MFALQPVQPLHRTVVAVDIEGSTKRTNTARARLRHAMYGLLQRALEASGIAARHYDPMVDRGDGALLPIHPVDQVPKTLLLATFIPALCALLTEHNARAGEHWFRLRAALHAGEIHYDDRGPFGEDIDIACRLVDAPELKDKLRATTAPLVLAVSDDLYRSVIRHGYDGIDEAAFQPLLRLDIGGQRLRGWVYVPADVPPVIDAAPADAIPAQYAPPGVDDHRSP